MLGSSKTLARSLGNAVRPQATTAPLRHCTAVVRRRCSRRAAVSPMAFLSDKNEQLCGLARSFVQTWGSAASKGIDAVQEEMRGMVADDAVFEPDGVLYTEATKGLPAILHALQREHKTYEHLTYFPVAVAADDVRNLAFVGVAWEYKNTGALPCHAGSQPSGRVSRGFSIKQLEFDEAGKLKRSRVNRQLTQDEQEVLLNPGTKCQPADIFGDVLPKLGWGAQEASEKPVADAKFAAEMSNNLAKWVSCWSSEEGGIDEKLEQVLSPTMMAYDAYGLHAAADKPGREGHAVSMMGRQDAAAAIKGLHKKFSDRNTLLASAVNPDMRVAFVHWRGEADGRDSSAHFVTEGVDMLLFGEEGRITTLVQFDMQDYSRLLRSNAPAGPA